MILFLLKNGYWQDGLKAVIYLIPLIYIIIQRKRLGLKYYWLFCIGLILLFFGNLLDFIDEFESLKEMVTSETLRYLQDFLEDVVGLALGFAFFILAVYLEFQFRRNS